MVQRTVNRTLLDEWLAQNGPDGISKLAVQSRISASTIQKVRGSGEAPKKLITLQRLCKAMNCDMDVVFPPVTAGEGEAS